jgi:hypothetical protein
VVDEIRDRRPGAALNQGFALPLTPVRGTGEAGPGDKPGWSKGGS